MRLLVILLAVLAAAPALAQTPPRPNITEVDVPPRPAMAAAQGSRWMVSAANPAAVAAGEEILRAGGSAADAALAIQLVLSLVEPQSSGVGGGGFLLYFDAKTGGVSSFDGRETAPASIQDDFLMGPDGKPLGFMAAISGGRVVGVPGWFRLMEAAHKRHGKLPWARLFQPAIRLAEQGYVIGPRLYGMLDNAKSILARYPAARDQFLAADGAAKPVGTVLKSPAYAKLLRQIARRGADAYYTGSSARRIVKAVTAAPEYPVKFTAADLKGYKAIGRAAVCGPYRGLKVCSMGPPSSGATTLLAALAMLEPHDLKALGPSPQSAHLIASALAVAFADREKYLADPAFVQVPVAGLLDPAYLTERAKLIQPGKPVGPVQAGTVSQTGTSHWSVVDADGNAASLTGTVQGPFGAFIYLDGYFLNNELTDFAFQPEVNGQKAINRAEPGKRPRSSMTPVIVLDAQGRPVLALGSAGGSRIIAHVLKTLAGVVDWGLDIQQAIDQPNIFFTPQGIEIEQGAVGDAWVPALEAMGHKVTRRSVVSGAHGVQIIREGGQTRLLGGADLRREGVAKGE